MWTGTWEQETEIFEGNTLRRSSCSGLIIAEDDDQQQNSVKKEFA